MGPQKLLRKEALHLPDETQKRHTKTKEQTTETLQQPKTKRGPRPGNHQQHHLEHQLEHHSYVEYECGKQRHQQRGFRQPTEESQET